MIDGAIEVDDERRRARMCEGMGNGEGEEERRWLRTDEGLKRLGLVFRE